jgi:hypothetical protein
VKPFGPPLDIPISHIHGDDEKRERIKMAIKSANASIYRSLGWVTVEGTDIPQIGVWLRQLFTEKELFELSLQYSVVGELLARTPKDVTL